MRKRITSLLLTLAMLLSLLPAMGVTASAAETGSGTADDPYVVTTYEELQTAMQKAGGSYVRLGKDIDTTNMNDGNGIGRANLIVVNSNVSLDLYGHKVTLLKYNTERSGLIDVRRGSLTIEDSKGGGELNGKNMTTGTRLYLIECYDGAKVTVNSGKLTMWSAQTAQTANAVIKNSGTVEINGGTLAISNQKNYDEVDLYLAQQDCAVSMTSLDGSSVVINGGTFDGRVLLYAHAKSESKAGSVINGGDFKKSVYVQKDRTKTGDVPLDVSIRGGTYHYTPGYRTNKEGKTVSDPQDMFQFATLGFLEADRPYYDEAPYFHGTDPKEGELDQYDLKAFRSIFPTNAILVAKGQSYTHRDYRTSTGNKATEVQLVDKLFTGADNTEWARLMNSEYQTIDVVSDIQLEDATLKVGDTTVPDNGGNVTTGDKTITITGKVNKQIAQLVQAGKIDLGFSLTVVKTTKPVKYLDTKAATLSTASNSDGRLNVTVTLPSAQLVKADYSVRLDLFPKQPGTTTTIVGEGLLPSSWKLSADDANKLVTINYNNNGGSGSMASQKVMSGKQPYTLPNCTFTAPAAGQVFKGWSTTQDGTGLLNDGKLPLTEVGSSVTVYAIWGVPTGMEIDKVTLSVKNYSQRQSTNDFRVVDRTPSKEMSFKGFWIYEGLSKKDGDPVKTYDKTKDYSGVYEFEAALGYQFAENISVDDVSANDGEVWFVGLFNNNKTLQVCVNYRSGDSIKGMRLKVKEPLAGDSSRDDAYEIRSTDGRYTVEYTDWYQGEFTDNSQLGVDKFAGKFEAGQKYTCAFRVKANAGYKVAHGFTSALYLNEAQVTNCTELVSTGDNAEGYYGLYTFTAVDAPDTISKVTIQVMPKAQRTQLNDFRCQDYTPAGSMGSPFFVVREGLNTDGTGSTPASYDKNQDYSVVYEFPINSGCTIAADISKADVTINDGQVWQVKSDGTGEHLLVYVNFPAAGTPASQEVSNVHLNFKPVGLRHQIVDMSPVNWTPGAGTLKLYNVCYYDGADTDADANKLESIEAAYDRNKAYTVSFQLIGETDVVFADGFDASSITLSDGKVWKVQRIDKSNMVICVTFPASGDTASKINAVNLTIKPHDQRHTLADFAPTASTPEGMSVTSTDIYKDGTLYTGSYDANTAYNVGYSLNTKSGYAFADGFTKENVTVSNGTVQSVNVINNNYVIVYVDFPVTGPTPETKTIEKINLDFKPYSGRSKISDLTPAYTPGTDMMQLGTTVFYEGDTIGSTLLDGNAAYDSTKNYTATFQFDVKTGVAIAAGFAQKDVSVSNGTIKNVVVNANSIVITVNFPKDPTTDPNYVTEAAVQVAAPVAGEHPKGPVYLTVTSGNADKFETALMFWFDMNDSDTFEVGKEYTANVYLKPKAGVTLADDMKLKINGKDAKLVKTDDSDGSVQFQLKIAAVDSSTPAPTDYTVTVTSGGNGSVSASPDKATAGTEIKLTAKADSGYHFKEWQVVSGGVTIKDNKFIMPAGNVEIKAIFEKDAPAPSTYSVSVTSGGNGSVSASPAKAAAGTEITLTATPNSGYHFKEWQVVKGGVTIKNDKFTMPADNVEIKAIFEKDAPAPTEYAVSVTSGGNGTASADHIKAVAGTEIKLTANADSGYHFKEWKVVSGSVAIKDNKFNMPAGNVEIKAIFEKNASTSGGGGGGGSVTTYAITVNGAKNGGVTASHKTASKGTTVTLTVDPDKGYVLDTLTVLDSKDKAVKLTEKNGKYTFTMPAGKVTVAATFKASAPTGKNPFIDVPAGSYYEDAVVWAVEKGITSGTSAVTFDPNGNCTRAQAVTFLWRAAGSPAPKTKVMPFADVKAGSYYYDAVLWAVEQGITKGTSDTMFSPDATCTRAQIVTFLWRANGSPAVSGNSAFTDVASDAYYAAAVTWAEKNDVTGGIGGGLFGSGSNCTRAQIVTFIYRSVK